MLIDDDNDDQEIFQLCLERLECPVDFLAMNSCPEAINWFRDHQGYIPDFIFLDVNMPLINGLDCLKELRTIDRLEKTKIYMFSTTTQRLFEDRARNLGAAGFIVKPARSQELTQKLHEIILSKTPMTCKPLIAISAWAGILFSSTPIKITYALVQRRLPAIL